VLTGGSVEFKQSDQGITLTVPTANHDAMATLIVLDIDKPAMEIATLEVRNAASSSGTRPNSRNTRSKASAISPLNPTSPSSALPSAR